MADDDARGRFRCQDCGDVIVGTPAEITAQCHGLKICQGCLDSMEDEADAYESEMVRPCDFFERHLAAALAATASAADRQATGEE